MSLALETLGDRWSLLIVRDLMVRGLKTFKQFQESDEQIASNILADRLHKLEAEGIIHSESEKADGRKINYRLTQKGIDLAPLLLEVLIWGSRYEQSDAPVGLVGKLERGRELILAETRRRWRDRDSTPLIPRYDKINI